MTVRQIVYVPDPILKRKAKPVTKIDDKLQKIIDDMIETLHNPEAPGVGLAAPQIGISERLAVVEYYIHEPKEDEDEETIPKKVFVLINPEITRTSKDTVMGTEGCLSIPGIVCDVNRFEGVTVKAKNRHGQDMTVKATGWLARIFQHEIDHLNGILITDPERAEKIWKLLGPEDEIDAENEM